MRNGRGRRIEKGERNKKIVGLLRGWSANSIERIRRVGQS